MNRNPIDRSKLEFVGGVVDLLDRLEATLLMTPEILAEELLRSTLVDTPRPPWKTGELRNSGVVYVGGQLYMHTFDLPNVQHLLSPNPAFFNPEAFKYEYGGTGLATARHESGIALAPQKLRRDKLNAAKGAQVSSLRNKVTVFYNAPHAALMHEWSGGFSDADSGAHFVSSKVSRFTASSVVKIKQIWKQNLGGR